MAHSVYWGGSSFWHQLNTCDGRFRKLQSSLSRRNIFAKEAHLFDTTVQAGDIIPIPGVPIEEFLSYSGTEDAMLPRQLSACIPTWTVERLLSLGPRIMVPTSPRSLLDQRIAELEAALTLDGASRIAASPKILFNLRPELPLQVTSLTSESGIARLPSETIKRIVIFVTSRADICALSRVSKRWRSETVLLLYSTLVLRGWDEAIVCLRSVSSSEMLSKYVNDLTVDVPYVPEPLVDLFFSTLEKALDETRNLRRLVLTLNNDKKTSHFIISALARCRFRLHHFVYTGPEATAEFLELQTCIRTLQISYTQPNHDVYKAPADLPPYVTQLWVSLAHDTYRPKLSSDRECVSHLSFRGDSMLSLRQLVQPGLHYLAFDVSAWLSSTTTPLPYLPSSFGLGELSGLRILRLVGYCIVCETPGFEGPVPTLFTPEGLPDPLAGVEPIISQNITDEIEARYNIGNYFSEASSDELESIPSPTLLVEHGFLTLLSKLPNLQALEVGSFVVRDAGRFRARPGYGRRWLAQRARWEEEFVHCVTSQATPQLLALSFLAYDEPLYSSGFDFLVSPRRWYDHIETVKKRVVRDEQASGVTLSDLIIKVAGVTPWPGCSTEPDRKCDYRLNSTREQLSSSRLLVEEVVTNEWVKAGPNGSWIKRINVRNLRDIWPVGC